MIEVYFAHLLFSIVPKHVKKQQNFAKYLLKLYLNKTNLKFYFLKTNCEQVSFMFEKLNSRNPLFNKCKCK